MLVPKDIKEKKLDKLKKENSQGCMENEKHTQKYD